MPFGWCIASQHDQCIRTYQRFVIEPQKKRGQPPNKVVLLDEWRECDCRVRSCECYKRRNKDKPAKKAVRRRKK